MTVLAAILAACLPLSRAADRPASPRLDAGPDARLVGGFQAASGEDAYEIFSCDPGSAAARPLGRYNGVLAGVAASDDGSALALTRDGALSVCGDDARILVHPDARWRMLGLAWWRGAPLAVTRDGDDLYAARPGEDGNWVPDEKPLAREGRADWVDMVALDGELHLFLGLRADDLSAGAVRHLILRDDRWREAASLPLGDVASFAAFRSDGRACLAATVPDPAGAGEGRAVCKALRDGEWRDTPLPPDLERFLAGAEGMAAASGPDSRTAWLATGAEGAVLRPLSPTDAAEVSRVAVAPGIERSFGVDGWMRLLTLAGLAFLIIAYCRRSRALSRKFPARPPDLASRAAALGLDWLLVSMCMSAYHIANGDARILPELVATGGALDVFWVNIGALIAFMTVTEGLYGCTPGKRLAGLRVRSALGGPPGVLQAMSRNVMRIIDMFPLPVGFPGLIGLIACVLNPRRQRVGDVFAGTMVRRHLPLRERSFLLASASPRRLELMRALGVSLRAEASAIDEDAVSGPSPEETVRLLSEAKARAARLGPDKSEVVVAADTVVVLDGETLGKPRDADDARNMLRRLSGRSHTVFTGVTVWDAATGQEITDVEQTEVEFRDLSDGEIDRYVATGDPLDKAGAYGVQTAHLVKQVRGSLSNVAGLPMEKLQGILSLLDS